MTDWKISKQELVCRSCERVFEEGEAHVSALCVNGEELAREDHCLACWKKRAAARDLFWWRTRHSAEKKRGIALNLEALEALFVRLEGRREVALAELRYVLCLVLMRKRRLKIERVERDDTGEALIVSRPRIKDLLRVAVYDFSPEKIDELRSRLQEVFEGAESDTPDAPTGAATGEPIGASN